MFTRFRSTDPINSSALNQRFQEVSDAVADVVRVANQVEYTPDDPADWNPDPTNVQDAIDALAAKLVSLHNRAWCVGLELSANSVTNTVSVGFGACVSSDNATLIEHLTSALAVDLATTGINGLDTGSVAANTWYYISICKGSSGVGVLASTSFVPALPSGYNSAYRILGQVRTNGSAVVRSMVMPPGQGLSRRVYYREVTNASPFLVLDEADIGTSGAQTTVDCSALVPSMLIGGQNPFVIAMIECNTPGAAVDVFWNPNSALNTLLVSQPGTAHTTTFVRDLELDTSRIGRIYGSATDEDISMWIIGYLDHSLMFGLDL